MKTIIQVIFEVVNEPDPRPPALAIVPKTEKFVATVKVISRYRIGENGVEKVA